MNVLRVFNGEVRSECTCADCVRNCRFMPGFLIPEDLDRIAETVPDLMTWADAKLLASPGATVADMSTGRIFKIRTLVPATKPDGTCIHLTEGNRCGIHANAPFGCAFFDCQSSKLGGMALARKGLLQCQDFFQAGLYGVVWRRLWAAGKRQVDPIVLISRMNIAARKES